MGERHEGVFQRSPFQDHFLYVNPTHYSNEKESLKFMKDIVVPSVEKERVNLNLPPSQPAGVTMDVSKGQLTTKVLGYHECVPNNMTSYYQPLDVSVNRCAKSFMKRTFTTWYAEQIGLAMEDRVQFDKIEVKLTLTILKPVHAKWLMQLYGDI